KVKSFGQPEGPAFTAGPFPFERNLPPRFSAALAFFRSPFDGDFYRLCSDRSARYCSSMSTDLIALRPARPTGIKALASIHEAAWRGAYRGLLSGIELERMIARRGPAWWRGALDRRVMILLLEVAGRPVGYATYGRSRMRELPFEGEIYELYLLP